MTPTTIATLRQHCDAIARAFAGIAQCLGDIDLPTPADAAQPAPPEIAPRVPGRAARAVLAAFAEFEAAPGSYMLKDVADRAGITIGYFRVMLGQLVGDGRLERIGHGRYRPIEASPAPASTSLSDEPRRRHFAFHAAAQPERITGLGADHPAIIEGRTLFPSTVVNPEDSLRLLISGRNSRKIGDRVSKGAWRGMPIFVLTLEERASCPRDCLHWNSCYGNGMQMARRHRHGPALVDRLAVELAGLQFAHPDGFVVRLHQLGDFYSVAYVDQWLVWLAEFPALRVFGYTAWSPDTEIGAAVSGLRDALWPRFAVRTSAATSVPHGATTIWRQPESARVAEGIVCPAQTNKTACCGSCGLCWAPAAQDQTIVFIAHGRASGRVPGGDGVLLQAVSA